MSTESSRRAASIAFILLLALSVLWPEPVVDINRLCCDANLGIDDLSFLGREAPSWDVLFWCIAGLFFIALVQRSGDYRVIADEMRSVAARRPPHVVWWAAASAAAVAAIWRWADAPLLAWSENADSRSVESVIRYANRFGGGMNPVMIIGFFVVAGVAYTLRHWVWYGVAMAIAGGVAGIAVQLVKFAVGRTRPELWLGPFRHVHASASSFPSGHTVGAFALAGVLLFHASSRPLRVAAVLLAIGVAASRVLAFRHWPSDVAASAAIGLTCASWLRRAPQNSR
jgi:membrane-associated phospholipid phosphatase